MASAKLLVVPGRRARLGVRGVGGGEVGASNPIDRQPGGLVADSEALRAEEASSRVERVAE